MADILSQEEVDLLLSAVAEGELAGEHRDERAPEGLHHTMYDFRRPERVSKEQLKGLQSLFEAFAREVSIVFPPFLRTVVRVDLVSIDQLTYDEFILSVARPTALTVVNMSPLEGNAVIEYSPTMVFPIIDRLLGGRGMALSEPRELTEIENRVMARITLMMLDSLRRSWDQLIEFQCSIVTQESDPLIVQIVAGSEMVILVGYEIHIGDIVGSMNICVPLVVLAPVLDQISQQAHFMRKMPPEQESLTRAAIEHTIRKALVPVDAILGETVLPLYEVARLQVGDIVQLDSSPERPITVTVGGVPRFLAEPGRQREQSAVQLSGFIAD
ncbi:MAG TPA: flagellar motor switch protein FliM [Candidatus Hydrogenedentes bacterium]|nr:flagellar motor switch protein FliM [Candidatus Hydrogenedentota bacterium]HRT22039.1 flagellar motor switch protein FliM [Candidatus Hydrogenedentota bacterium]HRT66735.1 flagellar motor switch protein FliM [Candidatus Hydrogenedentota bacterium]